GETVKEISKESGKTKNFSYRADGRMARFQDEKLKVNYFYDALDRRVAKVIQGQENFSQSYLHLDSEDRILLGKAGDGAVTKYIDGQMVDEHLGEVRGSDSKAYVLDNLGSVLNSKA